MKEWEFETMATAAARAKSDTAITLRLPVRTRELIDSAAATLGKSRTEFMLESARQHALDVLLDQRVFSLDAEAGEAFARALENPPAPVEALRTLMTNKSPWP
jgi:uncharacterized protein (DUF1778 family)